MKPYLSITLILTFLSISLFIFADPGTEIPKPKHKIEEAVKLVRAQFEKDAKKAGISKKNMKDWIITNASYVPIDKKKPTESWCWMSTFTHRIYNDQYCIIQILPDGKLKSTGIIGK